MFAKYYQENKEMLQKRLVKASKISLKNKETKRVNILATDIEIFL